MKDTLDFHRGACAWGAPGGDGATTAGSFSNDLNLGLIHHGDCVPLLRTCGTDAEGEKDEQGASSALQVQTRCTRGGCRGGGNR